MLGLPQNPTRCVRHMYGEAILNEYINTCRIRSTIQMVVDAADMHH